MTVNFFAAVPNGDGTETVLDGPELNMSNMNAATTLRLLGFEWEPCKQVDAEDLAELRRNASILVDRVNGLAELAQFAEEHNAHIVWG